MPVEFFRKMKGSTQSPPRVSLREILLSWAGGITGIATVAFLNDHVAAGTGRLLIIASFGASAVLIFGAIKSPLAQPRNLVGGHIVSALVGVTVFKLLSPWMWLAAGVAVGTAIAAMHATKTLHPPAGATSLIAVIGGTKIQAMGYSYALMPVGAGALILLVVALVFNNLPKTRRYPEYWI
jgi:CBS-domain-containing membrane protein